MSILPSFDHGAHFSFLCNLEEIGTSSNIFFVTINDYRYSWLFWSSFHFKLFFSLDSLVTISILSPSFKFFRLSTDFLMPLLCHLRYRHLQ